MFGDDTTISKKRKNKITTSVNLEINCQHICLDEILKIKINSDKSIQINFTLRKTKNIQVVLN